MYIRHYLQKEGAANLVGYVHYFIISFGDSLFQNAQRFRKGSPKKEVMPGAAFRFSEKN